MNRVIPYPLDYQFALERTLRIRLDAVRAAGRGLETCILEQTLARLRSAEFGTCLACGGLIPFLEMAADPTRQTCRACLDQPCSALQADQQPDARLAPKRSQVSSN